MKTNSNIVPNNKYLILTSGDLYYKNNNILNYIYNVYNLTNQTFTSTTNVIYLNTLAENTVRNNTEIRPILNTIKMNYIVATTGVWPPRP